jgi:hypothetical protein
MHPIIGDWRWGALISFGIYSGLLWWQIWTLQEENISKMPQIELINVEIIPNVILHKSRPTRLTPSGKYSKEEKGIFFHVVFENNPKKRTSENTANNVSAKVTYFDKNDRLLLGPIYGRWSDSGEPINPIDKVKLINTNILSNGTPRMLDLFMKFTEDEFCYAYNNDSYFFENWRHENYKIEEDIFFIQVELIGERLEKEFWFTVYNIEKGNDIRLSWNKDDLS